VLKVIEPFSLAEEELNLCFHFDKAYVMSGQGRITILDPQGNKHCVRDYNFEL
jgi:hypothetical protein